MNLQFNRACDEANPNMAALVLYGKLNEFLVRIFDISKYVWLYAYRFRLANRGSATSANFNVRMPMASDGGLVCFVSTWKYTEANPLCIVVINLLTRVQHELPPLQHVYTVPPTVVHMKMDSETKGYKVVTIFTDEGHHTVETYDSILREWRRAAPSWGRILGCARDWKIDNGNCFGLKNSCSCAFDFEKGQLELLHCRSLFPFEGAFYMDHALVGDRVFVLQKKRNQHDITEFQFQKNVGMWVPFITEFQFQNSVGVWLLVKTQQCFPEEVEWPIDLKACEGVLMLRRGFWEKHQVCSLFNFLTSEWHNLPKKSQIYICLMCRVFWNVVH